MICVTTEQIAGKKIVKTLGLVRGNTVRSRHLGRDILAGFKNIVGGEIEDYTKLIAESREQANDRMQAEAKAMGANAIVAIDFATSMISHQAAEIVVYGTAVIVEDA